MIVVADTGPLHYLILLDHADLLPRLYGEVLVPDAVATELSTSLAPTKVREWMLRPPKWLEVVPVKPERIAAVSDELDLGERAAIALRLVTVPDVIARLKATNFYADDALIESTFGRWLP